MLVSVFYACKKTDDSTAAPGTANGGVTLAEDPTSQRSAGTVTYYSKNGGDTVYQMVLTTDANGIVDIDRTIYSTTQPENYGIKIWMAEDVVRSSHWLNVPFAKAVGLDTTSLFADSVHVDPPQDHTYYVIPFRPGTTPQTLRKRATFYCQCGCIDCAQYKEFACLQNGGPTSDECAGLCDYCKAIVTGCPTTLVVPDVGGVVIIDANGFSVSN